MSGPLRSLAIPLRIVAGAKLHFFHKRFLRRYLRRGRAQAEEVPVLAFVAMLANVPVSCFGFRQGEQRTGGRLVAVFVALDHSDLVQYTAPIEEDTPTTDDAQH